MAKFNLKGYAEIPKKVSKYVDSLNLPKREIDFSLSEKERLNYYFKNEPYKSLGVLERFDVILKEDPYLIIPKAEDLLRVIKNKKAKNE